MNSETMVTATAPADSASRRLAVLICAVVVVAILIVFRDTVLEMVDIWRRSEVFSYGFFVLPIAVWLAWGKRSVLAGVPVQPFWPGMVLLAGSGFLWLLGSLADAAVVKHLALVLMVQCAVLSVFGLAITRALQFPIAFLLFAVPFGDPFIPKLMDWTADFTVLGLKLSGVPVYREGNSFVIPSGAWSVVEACSGIRYLIASVMAGTLYAYLMYRRAWKRVLFFGAAILVPIVANWLRAYFIVMLGHLSGNKLAVGVDHLLYGWIFFGIVIFAMFWFGARYREDTGPATPTTVPRATSPAIAQLAAAASVALISAAIWPPLATLLNTGDEDSPLALSTISGVNGWTSLGEPPTGTWKPRFLKHRVERLELFEKQGERVVVGLYYYTAQAQGRELVNVENVLVTTQDPIWREVARGRAHLPAGTMPAEVQTARLSGARGRFDVAWWYWVAGRTTTSDVVAKILLAWSRLRLQGDDSAAVFLYTEPSERDDGEKVLQSFAADMGSQIAQALARARGGDR